MCLRKSVLCISCVALLQVLTFGQTTGAVDYGTAPLKSVTGLVKPPDLAARAAHQNAVATNTLQESGLEAERTDQPNASISSFPTFCAGTEKLVDFRVLGYVSPVKAQGTCGACWAFATNAVLESAYLSRRREAISASEQELISCYRPASGCSGGWWAFDFVVAPGVESASHLPYKGRNRACPASIRTDYSGLTWAYVITDPARVNEAPRVTEMKEALCKHGSLAIGITADGAFQAAMANQHSSDYVFSGGPTPAINHAVELVGWSDDKQAWLIKNSWGPVVGQQGFMWVRYGANRVGEGAAWLEVQPLSVRTDILRSVKAEFRNPHAKVDELRTTHSMVLK